MKWIIFTGTWRLTNEEVEKDVRQAIRNILEQGNSLVTGGATGVDYFAMEELIKLNPACDRIKIFIPAKLDHYINDYRKNWKHSPITDSDIDKLEKVLRIIKERNPDAIFEFEKDSGDISQEEYNLRHNGEVASADEVYVFQVNNSSGVNDTLQKAEKAGLPITLHKKYIINDKNKI